MTVEHTVRGRRESSGCAVLGGATGGGAGAGGGGVLPRDGDGGNGVRDRNGRSIAGESLHNVTQKLNRLGLPPFPLQPRSRDTRFLTLSSHALPRLRRRFPGLSAPPGRVCHFLPGAPSVLQNHCCDSEFPAFVPRTYLFHFASLTPGAGTRPPVNVC